MDWQKGKLLISGRKTSEGLGSCCGGPGREISEKGWLGNGL